MVDIQGFVTLIALVSLVLGLLGMILLWRKGKTAEAIGILNTALLVILILLSIFPR